MLMVEPKGALPHDDHFHVRLACPGAMAGCIEYPAVARKRHPASRVRTIAPHSKAHPETHAAPHRTKQGPTKREPEADTSDPGRLAPEVPGLDSVVTGSPITEDDVDGERREKSEDFEP
jgi:hypothetical protein